MSIDSPSNSDQARLVDGIRQGDLASESTFIERYRKGLVIMLERRTGDWARAEDLTHDTLMAVLAKLRESPIDDPTVLTRYVYQTAKFIHIGWQRKKTNQIELKASLDDEIVWQNDQEYALLRRRQVELATQLINELPVERDRELLLRFYVHEQPRNIVCDALGLKGHHFDRVLNRARRRFKALASRKKADLSVD